MAFGILTLATPDDYRKAIGLALSLRVSNPGVPTAVACSPKLRARLAPYFDRVIDEDPTLRGFVHKVHLDRYSPFDDTFFFDSDVLVFRDLKPKVEEWNDQVYNATGGYLRDGSSYLRARPGEGQDAAREGSDGGRSVARVTHTSASPAVAPCSSSPAK